MTNEIVLVALNFGMFTLAVMVHQGIRRAASGLYGQTMLKNASFIHLLVTAIASWIGIVGFIGALALPFLFFELFVGFAVVAGTFLGGSIIAAAILLPWHRTGSAFYESWYRGGGIVLGLCLIASAMATLWLTYSLKWS